MYVSTIKLAGAFFVEQILFPCRNFTYLAKKGGYVHAGKIEKYWK